jgi:hypothetical protein
LTKEKEHSNNIKKPSSWIQPLYTVFAVIAGILLSQLFLIPKTKSEQKIQAEREIVQSQFFYLKKIELFLEKGKNVVVLLYQKNYFFPGSDQPFAYDTVGVSVIIPYIVYVASDRADWIQLKDEIIAAKDKINPEIYNEFNQIVDLTIKYPFPRLGCPFESLQTSPWASQEIKGRFLALQEDLTCRVLRMLALVE